MREEGAKSEVRVQFFRVDTVESQLCPCFERHLQTKREGDMSVLVWTLGIVAGMWLLSWPLRTLVGLFAAPSFVGGTYLTKRLRAFGVPLLIVPPDVRSALVRDAWTCTGFTTGRLARREAFRQALDANALQYARWLLDPEAPLFSEPEFGPRESPLRAVFGAPLQLPPHVQSQILAKVQ
jgi:hypothetical protein